MTFEEITNEVEKYTRKEIISKLRDLMHILINPQSMKTKVKK